MMAADPYMVEAMAHGLSTFELRGVPFALHIRLVREINRHLELTGVSRAPEHVRGLVNLRGQLVTVVDLAARLGLAPVGNREDGHLIVLKTNAELVQIGARELATADDKIGLLVDRIGDVVAPSEAELEPPPVHLDPAGAQLLRGVLKTRGRTVGILDAEALLQHTQPDVVEHDSAADHPLGAMT